MGHCRWQVGKGHQTPYPGLLLPPLAPRGLTWCLSPDLRICSRWESYLGANTTTVTHHGDMVRGWAWVEEAHPSHPWPPHPPQQATVTAVSLSRLPTHHPPPTPTHRRPSLLLLQTPCAHTHTITPPHPHPPCALMLVAQHLIRVLHLLEPVRRFDCAVRVLVCGLSEEEGRGKVHEGTRCSEGWVVSLLYLCWKQLVCSLCTWNTAQTACGCVPMWLCVFVRKCHRRAQA